VIKRIAFGAVPSAGTAADAPPAARPLRAVTCAAIPELSDPGYPHEQIAIEWFSGDAHLAEYEAWLGDADPAVVATEHVMRGADWLSRRWLDSGEKVKHMALARRAAGLTPPEFAERWRSRAGVAGGTPIPDAARGRAYVQNHPVPRAAGEWPWDAVNEVYFDDVAGLRARVEWFRANVDPSAESDVFGESWMIAVREVIIAREARNG